MSALDEAQQDALHDFVAGASAGSRCTPTPG